MREEKIKVEDQRGFQYEVTLEYIPFFGFAIAKYNELIIADVELGGRLSEPMSDDDKEWESYEERFSEWSDEVKVNILPKCSEFFNDVYSKN